MTKPSTYLSNRFHEAVVYATEMHIDQTRKSTSITYICHPLGVASLVLEAGGDEDLAIAALLHDVPEDCGGEPRLQEIRNMFGLRVERIVRACSDSLTEVGAEKADWKTRKLEHLEKLEKSDLDALMVTAADRLHNARSIVTDYKNLGESLWGRFNAGGKENVIWYYESILGILESKKVSESLITPLKLAISGMKTRF